MSTSKLFIIFIVTTGITQPFTTTAQKGCDASLVGYYNWNFGFQDKGEFLSVKSWDLDKVNGSLIFSHDSVALSIEVSGKEKTSGAPQSGGISFLGVYHNTAEYNEKQNILSGFRYYKSVDPSAEWPYMGVTNCNTFWLIAFVTEKGDYIRFVLYPKEKPAKKAGTFESFGKQVWDLIEGRQIDKLKAISIADDYQAKVADNLSFNGKYGFGLHTAAQGKSAQYISNYGEYLKEIFSIMDSPDAKRLLGKLTYQSSKIIKRGYSDQKYLEITLVDSNGKEAFIELSFIDVLGDFRVIYVDRFVSDVLINEFSKSLVSAFRGLNFNTFYEQYFKASDINSALKLEANSEFETTGKAVKTEDINSLRLEMLQHRKTVQENWNYIIDEHEFISGSNVKSYKDPVDVTKLKFVEGHYYTSGYGDEGISIKMEDPEGTEYELQFSMAMRSGKYIIVNFD
jgi:hypothetical protein